MPMCLKSAFSAFALIAALSLLHAGCGARGRAQPASSSTTPTTAPAGAASACGPGRAAGASVESITSGGIKRSYRLYVPKSYDGSKPAPLVLNFHGFTSNARQQETYSHVDAQADASGFIAATPDGTGSPQRWYIYGRGEAGFVDDIAFVGDLIDHLEATLCIDPSRVYAMGISNGAGLSDELACQLNDRLAAIAPVAGVAYIGAMCGGKGPTPVVAFHGTADPLVPFEGGPGGRLNLGLRSVRDNVKDWATHNGCASDPDSTRVAADVVRESYSGCKAGADVVLYVVEDGGHTWPGASIDVGAFGKTTHSIDATALIWEFFAAHPKR